MSSKLSVANLCILISIILASCSNTKVLPPTVEVIKAPGVVEQVWVEPMVDVVDVPPGLDPEGQYYRPAHQAVVEVRQGKWQYQNKNE